jgi:uncharacterized membrane protein YdjX (TVP38/TMEM64 family)
MWPRFINMLIGLWLMSSPGLLNYDSAATDNGHIIGPILATFSAIAIWEATRNVRIWNYPLGVWLLLAPWILDYTYLTAILSDMIAGVIIIILCSIKGKVKQSFGGGWRALFKKKSNPQQNH